MKHHPFTKLASILVACLMTFTSSAFASDAELMALVKNMQQQMNALQTTVMAQKTELEALKAGGGGKIQIAPSGVEATPPMSETEFKERLKDATGGADKWLKDLKFKGDMRLRYEAFGGSPDGTTPGAASAANETDSRNRFRYRLRFGFEKKFTDELMTGFSLASGEGPRTSSFTSDVVNTDPTSTNTSMDNNFNFKPIYIEKVFASYSPEWAKMGPISAFNLTAGKFDNPFEKGSSDILWDRDVKPEGIYEKADFNLLDTSNFDLKAYLTAGQFILDEDANLSGDANLFAYQLGVNPVVYTPFLDRPVDVLSAVSFYDYQNYAKGGNFIIGGTSLARGNPTVPGSTSALAAAGFHIVESYTEVAFYPYGLPVRPFVDFAMNIDQEADRYAVAGTNDNLASALGIKIGNIVKKGDWEAGYAYKYIGANAVPGFNDSDFGYTGHSGKRGSVVKLGYGLTNYMTLNAAAFFVNNLNVGTGSIRDEAQNRFQMDMTWKF